MSLLKVFTALLLAMVLACGAVVNPTTINAEVTKDVAPAYLPTIRPVVAVNRHFRWLQRRHRAGLGKYYMHDLDFKAGMWLAVVGVLVCGSHDPQLMWAAAPAAAWMHRQKWTAYVTGWTGADESDGILTGPSIQFMNPNERPPEGVLKKVQWGTYSVRELYEETGLDYFLFLCDEPKEILGLFRHVRNRGLQAPDGNTWWPVWSSFGDKGCHVVFARDKMYPVEWLERLQIKACLNGKTSDFHKFMKRYRRLAAHPHTFGRMHVLSVQENWMGRQGWAYFTLVNPKIGKPFTMLIRPMIKNADGQSLCDGVGPKHAWDYNMRPLGMLSIGGAFFGGGLKGNMTRVTPGKKLPANFVISDPKGELKLDRKDIVYFNIQSDCHRYHFACTDTQSILHYGFEPFLALWSELYLKELKKALMDPEQAARMLGDVQKDADGEYVTQDGAWVMEKIACFYKQTKFQFNRVPYLFRLLVNMKTKGLRDLTGSNDRNRVRIELPRSVATRRYVAVWEDVIDETGLETDISTHLLEEGECMVDYGEGVYAGEVVGWRQPNGFWTFNILNSVGMLRFVAIYGEDFCQWMAKSPAIFVSCQNQAPMMKAWDGADFDDNVIVARGLQLINHFRSLPPFPEGEPDVESANAVIPASFAWKWDDLVPFIKAADKVKGIGYFCNRWMVFNYFKRLELLDAKYAYLLDGVKAPVHLLGRGSEHIVDSVVKLGGAGLEWAETIVKEFEEQLRFISPFFYWRTSAGEFKSRFNKKATARIINDGGVVRLAIDNAVEPVKLQIAEFDEWADQTYRTLPYHWGLDPVLYAMDAFASTDEKHYQKANEVRAKYASFFTPGGDVLDQMKAAQKWLAEDLGNWERTADVRAVMAILWQSVYHPDNLRTRQDSRGRSRYTAEDLIWGPAMVDTMINDVLGCIPADAMAPFPLEHQFVVTFDMNRKVSTGEITSEQAGKWVALGMKHADVILRPGDGKMNVYLPVKDRGDVLVGHVTDRNALRCHLFNAKEDVYARLSPRMLQDGNVSGNALVASIALKELRG